LKSAIDFRLRFGKVAAMAQTKTSLLVLSVLILAAGGARAQTPAATAPKAAPAAPAASATPPPLAEIPYDIIEIGSITGKTGAKAPLLKYNTKNYEDPKAIANEASDLMVKLLATIDAEYAVINAVKPEEPQGIKTIFERKPNGEWVVKGKPETPKVTAQLAAVYAKVDAAGKAMDRAALEALETQDFAHYLSNGTARYAAGDKEAASLIKAVAAYHTKVVTFFVHGDQISVVQQRLWTGDYKPNPMAAFRKGTETSKSMDTWSTEGGALKLMRSRELDEKMTRL
jgi:hypothetical protein